jgi:hypothetical protein
MSGNDQSSLSISLVCGHRLMRRWLRVPIVPEQIVSLIQVCRSMSLRTHFETSPRGH